MAKITTIKNFDDLKKAYGRDYSNSSFNQLLLDLTNSGFVLSAQFYKQLQDFMLATEAQKNIPVATLAQQPQVFPAAANAYDFGSPPVTIDQGGGGGDGGGGGGGGSAAGAMSLEEEFQLWKQQRDYEAALRAEEDRVQREWQAEQDRIERENRTRLAALERYTGLVGQFAGIQARARETLAGLQGDPFAFAAARSGNVNLGATPMQSFRGELGAFANRPLPAIDPNASLGAIEQQIMGLQGQIAPQAPGVFGMAGGGEVGAGFHRVLVGEAGHPEIVEGENFRVLPLTGRGQGGYNTESLFPALAPLYSGMGLGNIGFGGVPQVAQVSAGGNPLGFVTSLGGNVSQLGYNPRLIRNVQTGGTYYRDDQGRLQHITSPEAFANYGFNWRDVLNVAPEQLSAFGPLGGALTAKPPISGVPVGPTGLTAPFGGLAAPIIEPVTGAILPAPYRAAAQLNHWRLTDPNFYRLALSAYANSMSRAGDPTAALGYSQADVESEFMQALPTGVSHGLIGLR